MAFGRLKVDELETSTQVVSVDELKASVPSAADATPQPLGAAAIGVSTDYAREDHVHAMPTAADVGADPAGTASSAISTHEAAADPHPGYALESDLGGAALLDVGTIAGTVAAGDDSRLTTDLGYTPSTRVLTSSTGADVTLPLFTSTAAGLAPLSGGGTSNFLRADGTWAAPDTGGTTGQIQWNSAGSFAGVSGSTVGATGDITLSLNGTASTPPLKLTGTWFTGGTATTTKPHVLIEPTGTTSTAWSTSGTGLGINAATGFTGRLIDLQVNGTSNFAVDSTGRVSFPLGTAALPSLYPGTDTNTGIWSPAADTLAWSTGGSERARIDSAGRVGIGTSPSKTLDVAGDAKIVTTSATQNILLGVSSGGIGYKTQVDFGHPTVGARIESERLGANTQSSLSLWTTSPAGVITRALTIDQEQYVRLASGTGGIQFNGDTAAANALDDYEEGTFTPAIIGKTVAGTGTYSVNTGSYTKIGNRVLFNFRIIWTAHTGTGNMEVSGLPFTVAGSVSLSIRHTDLTSPAGTIVQVHAPNATQVVRLDSVATGGGASTPLAIDTAGDIMINGVYVV